MKVRFIPIDGEAQEKIVTDQTRQEYVKRITQQVIVKDVNYEEMCTTIRSQKGTWIVED